MARLPLSGIKVLELAGLAPVPFAGMVLADFGAHVCRIDKVGESVTMDTLSRGKRSICLNLKSPKGIEVLKRLSKTSDVLIEPFRPGVMERLGIGPTELMKANGKLVYVRLNGYGTKGDMSQRAGHDINYLATAGILSRLGRKGDNPLPPINLLGDFGGGSMVAVVGIMMALFERTISGKGQLIETSITEGSAYVSSFLHRSRDLAIWLGKKGENVLDSGAPFYETYKTKDDKYMAVGAIELQFYKAFIAGLAMQEELANQYNFSEWPNMKSIIAGKFRTKTQKEWIHIFHEIDACVTPVLEFDEAPLHPHNVSNKSFMKSENGEYEPSPAPKLSRTPGVDTIRKQPQIGENTVEILTEEGFDESEIELLLENKDVQQCVPCSSL